MRYYNHRILNEFLYANCRKNIKILIFLGLIFVIGIIFGLYLGGEGLYISELFDDSIDFTILIFTNKISFFAIIFRSFFINLQYFILVFIFSLTIYLLPLHYIFISYKGYVFGTAIIVFTETMGVQGFSNLLILVLPQQIILLTSISLFISYSFNNTVCFSRYRSFHGINIQFRACLIFFIGSLSNIIVQLLLIYVIIRPFNILI